MINLKNNLGLKSILDQKKAYYLKNFCIKFKFQEKKILKKADINKLLSLNLYSELRGFK